MLTFTWFLTARRRTARQLAKAAYIDAVDFARQPTLYRDGGVPDTVDGRFDLITLGVALQIVAWQRNGTPDAGLLGQALFDIMFTDMDRSLREMGVGDLGVPKRIKKMMTAFNGRLHRYAQAADDPAQWPEALRQNVYRGAAVPAAALSRLTIDASARLAALGQPVAATKAA